MKKVSKSVLIVIGLSLLSSILYIILPALWNEVHKSAIIGFKAIFGGNIKYNDGSAFVSVGNIFAFALPLVAALIAYAGKNQRSTFFFTLVINIASIILFASTKKFFLQSNYMSGMETLNLFVGPIVCIILSSLCSFVSIFGLVYKPDARLSRR